MFDILVIVLCLSLLIFLAYRGGNLVVLAPVAAMLAVILSGGGQVLASYTQVFMRETGGFIAQFFPLFLLGAIFGKLMDVTGSAKVLAEGIVEWLGPSRAILAVILSCAAMTYGGVSLFVVAFAVYPVAVRLFAGADLPAILMPATIALGSFCFTMTALPGSPSIQNAIPMPFFGTTPFAAPGLGIIAAAIMFAFGLWWLERRVVQIGPGHAPVLPPAPVDDGLGHEPSLFASALPLVLVLVVNFAMTMLIIPRMDTSYLALPIFGDTTIEEVRGIWSVITALTFSILLLLAMNFRRLHAVVGAIDQGAKDSLEPIFNTASLVGFGAVVATLAGFQIITDAVLNMGAGNVLVSLAFASALLAGMTGSASGGMTIALNALGETYLDMANAQGVSPELLHRVTVMATGSLDTLPHNGAVITLLAICGLTHRQAYRDLAMVCIVGPVMALVAVIVLGTLFGSF